MSLKHKEENIKGEDKFPKCETCGKIFMSKQNLEYHMLSKHKVDDIETKKKFPKCKICGKTLSTKQGLDYHISSKHEGTLWNFLVWQVKLNRIFTIKHTL